MNKITIEQAEAIVGKSLAEGWAMAANTMIEKSQYITAEEARKLGAGNVEWFDDYRKSWEVCDADSFDPSYQYRAIKQDPLAALPDDLIDPETKKELGEWIDSNQELPEQATVLRSDFDFIMQDKQRCVKLIEEVYTLLTDDKPIEAKELLQKRVNNRNVDIPFFIQPVEPTCQVKNIGYYSGGEK